MLINSSVQDPIFLLRQMGVDALFDYRVRDYNLLKNLVNPRLELGATPGTLNNKGFEAPYTAGVANGWTKGASANGTFSEETTLPWESEGTSAQKVTGNTADNIVVLSQGMSGLTLYRTYKITCKIKVESGTLRMRMVDFTPFLHLGWRDFTSTDEAKEYTFYICSRQSTDISIEFFHVLGSGSLTFTIDDFDVQPVENDIHLIHQAQAYDPGAAGLNFFDYSGANNVFSQNWNADQSLEPGSEFMLFNLVDPDPGSLNVQTQWDGSTNNRVTILGTLDSTPDQVNINVSQDGAVNNAYQNTTFDSFSAGKFVLSAIYDGPGGTEELRADDTVLSGSYISGAHQASLHNPGAGVPYFHAVSRDGGGNFTSRFNGKFYVGGFFKRVPTEMQLKFITALLRARH